jgi:hypothetical protein
MQFGTIVIFGGFRVAAALALFQTSAVVSVLLGWTAFREPDVGKRLAGAAPTAMTAAPIVTAR